MDKGIMAARLQTALQKATEATGAIYEALGLDAPAELEKRHRNPQVAQLWTMQEVASRLVEIEHSIGVVRRDLTRREIADIVLENVEGLTVTSTAAIQAWGDIEGAP